VPKRLNMQAGTKHCIFGGNIGLGFTDCRFRLERRDFLHIV
jgi:hypothetical protein